MRTSNDADALISPTGVTRVTVIYSSQPFSTNSSSIVRRWRTVCLILKSHGNFPACLQQYKQDKHPVQRRMASSAQSQPSAPSRPNVNKLKRSRVTLRFPQKQVLKDKNQNSDLRDTPASQVPNGPKIFYWREV